MNGSPLKKMSRADDLSRKRTASGEECVQNIVSLPERDKMLLTLANDFKRYYFEQWRQELKMQRGPTLKGTQNWTIAKLAELETLFNEQKQLQDSFFAQTERQMSIQKEAFESICAFLDSVDCRLLRLERICGLLQSQDDANDQRIDSDDDCEQTNKQNDSIDPAHDNV